MGKAEIEAFLTHLAVEGEVSAATQNQALSALLFGERPSAIVYHRYEWVCFDKIENLEEVLIERCQILSTTMTDQIKNLTDYHWWPEPEIFA